MLKTAILFLAAFSLSACTDLNGQIKAAFDSTAGADFARSQIIVGSPAAADGSSEVLVVIQLTNSDGTPVKYFKPTYEFISGGGVTGSPCTTSDANGISTCIVKATASGSKRLSVNNVLIDLKSDVVFISPTSKPFYELTSAGGNRSQSGYKLSASVGSQEPVVLNNTSGYKLFGGIEGLKASQ